MELTKTYSIDNTHCIDLDSWYRNVIGEYSWYRHGLMVLTTPMVLAKTHGIELLPLNPTHTRGPRVAVCGIFIIKKLDQETWLCRTDLENKVTVITVIRQSH